MPRRTAPQFACPALADLARQLLFTPPMRRVEQLKRSERLHDELQADGLYPLEFVVYRITGYRSDYQQDDLLVGEAVQRDLRLLIDQLSYSIDEPANDHDPVFSGEQLAKRWNVSTKTLSRWRKLGLRWRWVLTEDGRTRQVVYPQRSVELFAKFHTPVIKRATGFSHIAESDKQRLIERARRIASAHEVSPHQLAAHLARRTGRAVETLRLILLKYDQEQPERAIFKDRTQPLSGHEKRIIVRAFRMGVPMRKIVQRFERTRASLYRVIYEARAQQLRQMKLPYHELATFGREDAQAVYLRGLPEATGGDLVKRPRVKVDDLPVNLQTVFAGPMLTGARQQALLVRINYLHYRAAQLREQLDRYHPRAGQLDLMEAWVKQAQMFRSELIQGTAPMVLSAVRQHFVNQPKVGGWAHRFLPVLQQAMKVQAECIDQFDIGGKTSFQAYLNWALLRHLAGIRG